MSWLLTEDGVVAEKELCLPSRIRHLRFLGRDGRQTGPLHLRISTLPTVRSESRLYSSVYRICPSDFPQVFRGQSYRCNGFSHLGRRMYEKDDYVEDDFSQWNI